MSTHTTSDHSREKDLGAAARRGEDAGQAAAETAVATAANVPEGTMQAAESGKAVLEGMTRMQQEIVDFMSKRIRHNIETQQDLLNCRNFDDIREVQTRFFRTAMEEYASGTRHLMELTSEVVQRSVQRGA